MDFEKVIKERYSVRKFKNQEVEKDKIEQILKTAQIIPTATNAQPQRILVITDAEKIDMLKECAPFFIKAPLAFIICYDEEKASVRPWDEFNFGLTDACIATTYMMLSITNLGLGSTWVGGFRVGEIQKAFHLPKNIVPAAILSVGYPASTAIPSPKHEERMGLEKIVTWL